MGTANLLVEKMAEKVTRVLVSFEESVRMECKYSVTSEYVSAKSGNEFMEEEYGRWKRKTYKAGNLPSHIGVFFEQGVFNERIFYKKMAAEPVYLYYANDGEAYHWFISLGLPFKEDLCKSAATNSYQPPTTMCFMSPKGFGFYLDHFMLELLTDKDDAMKNTAPDRSDSYFEINRINKVNKQYSDKIAGLEQKLALAEEKLSVNKNELMNEMLDERIEARKNANPDTASEPKKVRSSA